MKGDLRRIVTRLKRELGKDMIVDGGYSVVQGVHAAGACRRLSYDGLAGHPRTWKTPLGLNVETTDPEALVLQESQTWCAHAALRDSPTREADIAQSSSI